PAQFRAVVERVRSGGMSLCEAERLEMGFTHSESGQALGEHWRLPDEIVDVIAWHHEVEQAKRNVALTALVHLADELCLRHGLDNGLPEPAETDLREDPAWNLLTRVYPYLSEADLEQFHLEMKEFTRQVTAMVGSLFGAHRAA
ncbi:MAG TPA: HDOD domain-containing protein, partial [Terriglobia bacterium]|nr:HDOD domain-containing protein [Terriglobia bacterium]